MSMLDLKPVSLTCLHMLGVPFGEPSRYSFEERVAAAATDGIADLGMDASEFDTLLAERSADDIKAVLKNHGVRFGELMGHYGWHFGGDYGKQARQMEDRLYEICDTFEITNLKTFIMTPTEMPTQEDLVERFTGVCDRAAGHGIQMVLEPVTVNPGFGYTEAIDLLLAADRPNTGLMIDCWHFFRDPDNYKALDRLPANYFLGVELRDAAAEPVGSRQEDCTTHNKLPGQGEFDLPGLLRYLDSRSIDVPLSVECMSDELRKVSAQENVDLTVAAVRSLLASA